MKIFVVFFMLSLAPMTIAAESGVAFRNTQQEVVMYSVKRKGKKAKRNKRVNRRRKRACSAHARRVYAG